MRLRVPDGECGPPIHLYKPFKNGACMQCHSTTAKSYLEKHADNVEEIRSEAVRCIPRRRSSRR